MVEGFNRRVSFEKQKKSRQVVHRKRKVPVAGVEGKSDVKG